MDGLRLEYLAKLIFKREEANVSILGAICKSSLITLSRKEVILTARSGKRIWTGEKAQAPKRNGAISSDFREYIEQVLTTLQVANTSYKYLALDNASIHKAALIEDWVGRLLFLSPHSPFSGPFEEYWSKLKTVVKNDPYSVRLLPWHSGRGVCLWKRMIRNKIKSMNYTSLLVTRFSNWPIFFWAYLSSLTVL